MKKDAASNGASVKTGLSEVSPIEGVGKEMDTMGKGQKPNANPKGPVKTEGRKGFSWK